MGQILDTAVPVFVWLTAVGIPATIAYRAGVARGHRDAHDAAARARFASDRATR